MTTVNAWPHGALVGHHAKLLWKLWKLLTQKLHKLRKRGMKCEIWSAKHLWILANRRLFPDFRETRPQRCVRDWGYLVFFCKSRLQTRPTLSISNTAYTSMSWCPKFHCIHFQNEASYIYGNNFRSRLRRCNPATSSYTDTVTLRKLRTNEGEMAPQQNYSTSYGKSQSCSSWLHRHMKALRKGLSARFFKSKRVLYIPMSQLGSCEGWKSLQTLTLRTPDGFFNCKFEWDCSTSTM